VPALIEIPERVIFGGRGLIRGELVYKLVDTMHFRIDSNAFVRSYLELGEGNEFIRIYH
jgi:hypothetical protein